MREKSGATLALFFIVGALLFLSFGFTEMAGSDLFWHVAGGREILEQQSLWVKDTWSYTEFGATWNNHEWLADIVYFLWVDSASLSTLVYWKWAVIVYTYCGLQVVMWRQTGSNVAAISLSLLAVALAAPFLDLRPHLYTLAGFVTLLLLVVDRKPKLWSLALLFLVWANTHGGFVFGLMALTILIFPWQTLSSKSLGEYFKTLAACGLVCLVNPDGVEIFLLPLTYAFDSSSPYKQLAEWLSPFAQGGIRSELFFWIAPLTTLIALAYIYLQRKGERPVAWQALALLLLALAMSLTSRRFIPLFGIAFALASAPLLGSFMRDRGEGNLQLPVLFGLLAFAAIRLWPFPLAHGPAFHYLAAEALYPKEVVNFVRENKLSGRVFAYYNWGGFLHLHTDGQLKVFIDGRANTIYDDQTYNDYVSVLSQRQGWLTKVEATGAEFFLWPIERAGGQQMLKALQASGRWRPVYLDAVGYLVARNTVELPEVFRQTSDSPEKRLAAAQSSYWSGQYEKALAEGQSVLIIQPYQLQACRIVSSSYRALNQPELAQQTIDDCRKVFPTRYLK
ncbi:MAG: hypothetical protein ABJ084_13255 [Halioglobus sp.]